VLPLAFTVIAFIGLHTYDGQHYRIEYGKAKYAARQSKNLLRRRHYMMHGYNDETPHSRRGKTSSGSKSEQPASGSGEAHHSTLQQAVDEFFSHNVVSQVMCSGKSCRMNVNGKVIVEHGMLGDNSNVFVDSADDDSVTFADASGNRYSRTIASLLGQ
jgi:hypothetical protein